MLPRPLLSDITAIFICLQTFLTCLHALLSWPSDRKWHHSLYGTLLFLPSTVSDMGWMASSTNKPCLGMSHHGRRWKGSVLLHVFWGWVVQNWIKTKRSADGANVPAGSDWHLCKFNSSHMVCSVSAVNKRKPLVQGFLKRRIGLFQLSECSCIRRRISQLFL